MVQRGLLQILLRIRSREAALAVRSTVVVQVNSVEDLIRRIFHLHEIPVALFPTGHTTYIIDCFRESLRERALRVDTCLRS
jgi:hypothetical protein